MYTSSNFQSFLRSMSDECLVDFWMNLHDALDCLESFVKIGDPFVAITATVEGDNLYSILLDALSVVKERNLLD